ncbi:MAG TPA: DUF2974 domain-containing protein [Planctomycetaceae bacterium]|nr:DUF2974 domain-containing protein [Planctomycetaceae bacterium]
MLSVMDLGILSLAAYADLPSVWGWNLLQIENNGPFFAAHFKAANGSHVVAVRGSELEWRDWLQDDASIVLRTFPPQCQAMAKFVARVRSTAGFSRVFFTGHSLGGYLAGYAAALTGCPVITFNAPGRLWPASLNDLTDVRRALHIRSAQDWLTMPTPDLPGKVIKLEIPRSNASRVAFAAASALSSSGFSMLVRTLGAAAEIHHQHQMDNLLNAISRHHDFTVPLPW